MLRRSLCVALQACLIGCSTSPNPGAAAGGGDGTIAAEASPPASDAQDDLDATPPDAACPGCPDGFVLQVADTTPLPDGPLLPDLGVRILEDNCADLYAQDLLPTFEVEIDANEWAAIIDEFQHPREREEAGLELKPYHPLVSFRYGDETVADAMIRLKSNPFYSWRPPKMQFVISFRQHDRRGRFHGLRKISLDAPWYDPTFLRERMALAFLRESGLPGGCANNARLVVNGQLYGLYVNREHYDKEFLERHYDDPEGNLYKYGWELKTNEREGNVERRDRLWATEDIESFGALVDRQATLEAWAAEAMLPTYDGYWCCNHNYYLYDHPSRGFIFIPYDLDIVFDKGDPRTNLITYGGRKPLHFRLAMADRGWRRDFDQAVARLLPFFDAPEFERRLDRWSAQIAEAVREDPNLPFEYRDHPEALQHMRAWFVERVAYLNDYVERATACERGESAVDLDNDGYDECVDCDDLNREIHPGAEEICNQADDNCSGTVDDAEGCSECQPLAIELAGGEARFALCPAAQNWFNGHQTCRRAGGTLALPPLEAVPALLDALEILDDRWWLGATDADAEGRWVGPDAEPVPFEPPWGPGQPNGGGDQNCALIAPTDGSWHDADCTEPHPVICQLP